MSEEIRHIDRREVEAYREEYISGIWRSWRCEIKVEPDDRVHSDWYFWFTRPPEKDEDGEFIGMEIYMAYGHKLYIQAAEIVYDEVGERISSRPLFTTIENLNNMVEHTKKIMKQFVKKYGL